MNMPAYLCQDSSLVNYIIHRRRSLYLLLIIFCFGNQITKAENVTTSDGKTYSNLKIVSETPDNVKILHDAGVTNVPKKTLPGNFLAQHEMKAPPESTNETEKNIDKERLAAFIATTPIFSSKDGQQFQSISIVEVELSGLRIRTDLGISRIKFLNLPEKVRSAFAYDPIKSAAYESERESKKTI